ncbi:hypothetical protein QC762_309485 [Podospora pseudocomata]|uniref:Uncharacterized protein n=1 Tax=Podospora pseudocomata TaxID=2093779 RepID=A0ABR0GKQ1_9PEZI|nr:hypothetical protein QC762_309485 [Podospora pseudocomata]
MKRKEQESQRVKHQTAMLSKSNDARATRAINHAWTKSKSSYCPKPSEHEADAKDSRMRKGVCVLPSQGYLPGLRPDSKMEQKAKGKVSVLVHPKATLPSPKQQKPKEKGRNLPVKLLTSSSLSTLALSLSSHSRLFASSAFLKSSSTFPIPWSHPGVRKLLRLAAPPDEDDPEPSASASSSSSSSSPMSVSESESASAADGPVCSPASTAPVAIPTVTTTAAGGRETKTATASST